MAASAPVPSSSNARYPARRPSSELSTPAEVLAAVPYLLGFAPERSVVVLCMQGKQLGLTHARRPGHARVRASGDAAGPGSRRWRRHRAARDLRSGGSRRRATAGRPAGQIAHPHFSPGRDPGAGRARRARGSLLVLLVPRRLLLPTGRPGASRLPARTTHSRVAATFVAHRLGAAGQPRGARRHAGRRHRAAGRRGDGGPG